MSMWEIEGLIEMGVQLVGRAEGIPTQERRNVYANLYRLQEQFDCSYTHFRCAKQLIDDGFLHRIDLQHHPAFESNSEALEAIASGGKEAWVQMDPTDRRSATAGLFKPSSDETPAGLYFDSSSPLWADAVAKGRIEGAGTQPVEQWSDATAFCRIMTIAANATEQDGDTTTLAQSVLRGFYGFALWHLPHCADGDVVGNPELDRILGLDALPKAIRAPTEDWIEERFRLPELNGPEMADAGESMREFLTWWRRPLDAPQP